MNKTIPAIIISLIAGVALGYYWGNAQSNVTSSAKIEAISKMFPASTKAISLVGKVERVDSVSLTLGEISLSPNLLAVANYPMTREVMITSATKITRSVPKTPAVFQAELSAFQKKYSENKTTRVGNEMLPPTPFTLTEIRSSDLSVGDTVVVTAASDILQAQSFTATQIQLSK